MAAVKLGAAGQGARAPPEPPELFCYGQPDLVLCGLEWRKSAARGPGSPALSRFDRALRAGWEDRLRRGLFRYRLGELQTRILPGRMGLVAQLNVRRGTERRRPQEVRSVQQKFDPRQFNFCKIRREEILFRMSGRPPPLASPSGALVVINVSPLEFGHILLIPDPARSLPQILTPEALRFGLDALLLSAHPGFRVGFNSLGAFASVNHLHLHGFYLNWELMVESAPCRPLLPEAGLHLLQEVPAPGFLFYSDDGQQLGLLTRRITRVTQYLSQREIAHNLFATRGAAPEAPMDSGARPGIRIILWARKACFGTKEESAFNVAVCELAGHLPTKTVQEYDGLTEASAIQRIQQCLLSDTQLAQLQHELVDLLREQPPSPQRPSSEDWEEPPREQTPGLQPLQGSTVPAMDLSSRVGSSRGSC
ncbi:GDP-D-glucose phosphorylase 1 [Candoia aspera]|uniref:GDP-D-glucose phosphorylase 1 n=1 Tax=Candoia aspera TaxID=51853 RepID=UPI002FD7DACC